MQQQFVFSECTNQFIQSLKHSVCDSASLPIATETAFQNNQRLSLPVAAKTVLLSWPYRNSSLHVRIDERGLTACHHSVYGFILCSFK